MTANQRPTSDEEAPQVNKSPLSLRGKSVNENWRALGHHLWFGEFAAGETVDYKSLRLERINSEYRMFNLYQVVEDGGLVFLDTIRPYTHFSSAVSGMICERWAGLVKQVEEGKDPFASKSPDGMEVPQDPSWMFG